MGDSDKAETILTDLRAALADLLSSATVRDRFREKVVVFCKPGAEESLQKCVPVRRYTDREGEHVVYGGGGPRWTPLNRLVLDGPENLDAAFVLLALIHDSGPHIGRVGYAAPDDWRTCVSPNTAPTPLDFLMACEWHRGVRHYMREIRAGVLEKVSAHLGKVKAECGLPVKPTVGPLLTMRHIAEVIHPSDPSGLVSKWRYRRSFPKPVKKGGAGRADRYEALRVLDHAVRHGDIEAFSPGDILRMKNRLLAIDDDPE